MPAHCVLVSANLHAPLFNALDALTEQGISVLGLSSTTSQVLMLLLPTHL